MQLFLCFLTSYTHIPFRDSLRSSQLEAVNEMLVVVEEEFARHAETKAGKKEIREKAKVCKAIYKDGRKAKSVDAGKTWEGRMRAKIECWVKMFEVAVEGEGRNTDGFVDYISAKAAITDLMLGEMSLLHEGELEEMIEETDIFKVGLLNASLIPGWVNARVTKRREEERAALKWHARLRKDVKCWGQGVKIRYTWAAFLRAAKLSMLETERRRYYVKALEAYRSGAQGGGWEGDGSGEAVAFKPRVMCPTCMRPFAFWTFDAQRHVAAGGCVSRPSKFLPMKYQDLN